jgi:hypothetical protein
MVFRSVDNTDFMRFIDGTGTIFNETGADLDFRIESDTNTHAFLLRGDNGYVGIGTSSPEAPLTIASGGTSTTSIGGYDINYGVNNIVTSGRTGYLCRVGNNFTGDGDNAGFMWIYPFDNGGNVNNKVFRSATGATLVDKFWVNQVGGGYFAGNVGIGTDSPAANSHVNGAAAINDTLLIVHGRQLHQKLLFGETFFLCRWLMGVLDTLTRVMVFDTADMAQNVCVSTVMG